MNIYRAFKTAVEERRGMKHLRKIQRKFAEFTMIPGDTYVNNLVLAGRVAGLPGCVAECGVWRGGMSAGLSKVLGAGRNYFLFDSFEGLPPARDIDGEAALRWQNDKDSPNYHDNCSAAEDYAMRAMNLAGVGSFKLVKGWFNETLPGFHVTEPISLLRLDGDWYESTMVCLESLFDHVAPGGLIIFDDYYTWDGCSRAVHDFLSRRSAVERIQSFRGICFIEKLAPHGSIPAS